MRRANVQRNWAQLNVPAVQPSAGAPNQGLTGGTANQAALTVLAGNLGHSSRGPHGRSTRYRQQLGGDALERQGRLAHGGVGGLAMGTRYVESSKGKEWALIRFSGTLSMSISPCRALTGGNAPMWSTTYLCREHR